MKKFEVFLKRGLLYVFCLLNAIDMAQTVYFVRVGLESNLFAVYYPYLWFPFKFAFAFLFPIGLMKLDGYLEESEDGEFHDFLRSLVGLLYFAVLIGDIFFLSLVLRNMSMWRPQQVQLKLGLVSKK